MRGGLLSGIRTRHRPDGRAVTPATKVRTKATRPPRRPRRPLIIAIDGPAGAGKSTVSRRVAGALGLNHIDTGAMYRALTWKALGKGIDPGQGKQLAALAKRTRIEYRDGKVAVDGRSVGREIRAPRVTRAVSQVSAHPEVRRELVRRQRELARRTSAVIEGRDIGTVVCPDADVKVFLTATPGERARRRHQDLVRAGAPVRLERLRRDLALRDRKDSTRQTSPLVPAKDAIVIDSTKLSAGEVVSEILDLARSAADARR
jgi:cytidylate kinase